MPRKKKNEVKEKVLTYDPAELVKGVNDPTEVEWHGLKFNIYPRMGYNEFYHLARVINDSCFQGDDYHPEYCEFLKDICLVSAHTDFPLPDENELRWQILYYTDLLPFVRKHIDDEEWYAFATVVEDMNRERVERINSVGYAGQKFVGWLESLTDSLTKFDKEDLQNLIAVLSEKPGGTD